MKSLLTVEEGAKFLGAPVEVIRRLLWDGHFEGVGDKIAVHSLEDLRAVVEQMSAGWVYVVLVDYSDSWDEQNAPDSDLMYTVAGAHPLLASVAEFPEHAVYRDRSNAEQRAEQILDHATEIEAWPLGAVRSLFQEYANYRTPSVRLGTTRAVDFYDDATLSLRKRICQQLNKYLGQSLTPKIMRQMEKDLMQELSDQQDIAPTIAASGDGNVIFVDEAGLQLLKQIVDEMLDSESEKFDVVREVRQTRYSRSGRVRVTRAEAPTV